MADVKHHRRKGDKKNVKKCCDKPEVSDEGCEREIILDQL